MQCVAHDFFTPPHPDCRIFPRRFPSSFFSSLGKNPGYYHSFGQVCPSFTPMPSLPKKKFPILFCVFHRTGSQQPLGTSRHSLLFVDPLMPNHPPENPSPQYTVKLKLLGPYRDLHILPIFSFCFFLCSLGTAVLSFFLDWTVFFFSPMVGFNEEFLTARVLRCPPPFLVNPPVHWRLLQLLAFP